MRDLIVAGPFAIPELPKPLRRFVTGTVEGRPTCHRDLTETERTDVEARLSMVRKLLMPASVEEATAEVMKLLMAFPLQELSEAGAMYRTEGYLEALSGMPARAIEKGRISWIRREFSEPTDNHAFAPTPPQLVRLCRIAIAEAKQRELQLERILAARTFEAIAAEREAARKGQKTGAEPSVEKSEHVGAKAKRIVKELEQTIAEEQARGSRYKAHARWQSDLRERFSSWETYRPVCFAITDEIAEAATKAEQLTPGAGVLLIFDRVKG